MDKEDMELLLKSTRHHAFKTKRCDLHICDRVIHNVPACIIPDEEPAFTGKTILHVAKLIEEWPDKSEIDYQ